MFRPLLAAAVVAVLAAPGYAQHSDFQDAYRLAVGQVGSGARLIKARTEGAGAYGFYFSKNRRMIEVEISRTAKKQVLKVASSETGGVSDDVMKLIAKYAADKVKLPEGRLVEIATAQLRGTPFSGEMGFKAEDGNLVFAVGDVRIDPVSGKVIDKK